MKRLPDVDDLRASLHELQRGPATALCSDAERIRQAVAAELPRAERIEVIDHVATCPACAESWRVAKALYEEDSPQASRNYRPWIASAAIVVLAALLFTFIDREPPEFRAPDNTGVTSLLDHEEILKPDSAMLRWSPIDRASYRVVVSTEALEVLADERGLTQAEFTIPESALEQLASGDRLLWRVEATRPDGTTLSSPTFVQRLSR